MHILMSMFVISGSSLYPGFIVTRFPCTSCYVLCGLVSFVVQYVVHQLYTTPEVDKEEEMLSLVDAHFNSCPNWDNVGDIEDIGDLYSGAKYRLEELILSKEKRDAYWKNYILSEDSMKGIWEDVQKKFSLILSDIESKSPKPLLAQVNGVCALECVHLHHTCKCNLRTYICTYLYTYVCTFIICYASTSITHVSYNVHTVLILHCNSMYCSMVLIENHELCH